VVNTGQIPFEVITEAEVWLRLRYRAPRGLHHDGAIAKLPLLQT